MSVPEPPLRVEYAQVFAANASVALGHFERFFTAVIKLVAQAKLAAGDDGGVSDCWFDRLMADFVAGQTVKGKLDKENDAWDIHSLSQVSSPRFFHSIFCI